MKALRLCGCYRVSKLAAPRTVTDAPIEATAQELESLRRQMLSIEDLLARLFGKIVYSREPESLKARAEAADLIDRHFDGIVDQWEQSALAIFGDTRLGGREHSSDLRENLSNALIRMIAHLRNPDDLTTYVYLRRHCEQGLIARAKPSEFNTIHIALKQVILPHVRTTMHGPHMELVRDVVVAAVDERRLMVSQFYIESRERLLRASEEKYRNSIEQSPDPIYEIDPHTWRILAANSAAQQHAIMPDAEPVSLVGVSIPDLVPPEMRVELTEHLRDVLVHGSRQAIDVPIGPRYFDVNMAVIPYGDKQFIQMILHDETQRRGMMDSLLKAERLAATGTFAAGVAHEVNNPLASISSLVQSLVAGEDDPQRRTTLHTILAQITRISSTLKDLVNFARPSTGHQKVVDINELIRETLRVVAFDKRFHSISLEPVLAPDLKPAFADENEIQQVLLNLLFNAADATPPQGGEIKVITENKPGGSNGERLSRVMIKLVDNGIGIPRENLERVFDPFFTTKPAGAGVGLGLSLCQRLILANKGTIRVDSEVGKGTEVTLLLPPFDEPQPGRRAELR
ncbi:MAG TPA: ATP-binding protein [Candidatus Binataceae bacterium]|nr:ATP-binding protein [Candidatus Binataceae bacterium]